MAISPVWTENQPVSWTGRNGSNGIDAGASASFPIDLANLGADRAEVQLDIIISNADSVTVQVLGSADSGTTDDTTVLEAYTVSANDRRTIILTGAFRRIKVTNNDGASDATGVVSALFAWRNWVSN